MAFDTRNYTLKGSAVRVTRSSVPDLSFCYLHGQPGSPLCRRTSPPWWYPLGQPRPCCCVCRALGRRVRKGVFVRFLSPSLPSAACSHLQRIRCACACCSCHGLLPQRPGDEALTLQRLTHSPPPQASLSHLFAKHCILTATTRMQSRYYSQCSIFSGARGPTLRKVIAGPLGPRGVFVGTPDLATHCRTPRRRPVPGPSPSAPPRCPQQRPQLQSPRC